MKIFTTKTALACVLLLAAPIVRAQTAQQYFDDGVNFLTATNLDAANLSFSNAVALSPADPTNNFFYAMTQLETVPDQPASSAFLSSLGFPVSGRNLYDWTARLPKNKGHLVVPVGVNADDFSAQLRTNVLVTMTNAENNLAAISGPRFTVELTENETHLSSVTVDYGDVLMMEAMLEGAVFCSYTIYSWNMDADLTDISTILTEESKVALLTTYSNAFTIATTNDLSAARGAFTNAINYYLAASQFIRADRPAGVTRLFNLSADQTNKEFQFRETLTNILASLTGPPVTLTANSNYSVSAAAFFSGTNGGPRASFPQFQGNEFIWDSFTDVTFGGVFTGLAQENLDRLFSHPFKAVLDTPGFTLTAFYSSTNSLANYVIAQGADGNLYSLIPYESINPFFGPIGDGAIFQVTPSGSLQTLYSFGMVTNDYGTPLDGATPVGLVSASDGYLYGTTQYGGYITSVMVNGVAEYVYLEGTIFKCSTNGILATLQSFYDTNGANSYVGYTPSEAFIQGGDGNFYGTTLNGGAHNFGVIFKMTPAGALTPIYAIGSNTKDGYDINSLTVTGDGTVYATTPDGGDNFDGAILKIPPGGTLSVLYSFGTLQDTNGNNLDGISPNSLLLGEDGNLYGTAMDGGSNEVGTAFECSSSGAFALLATFQQGRTNANYPVGSLVQNANGVLYGEAGGGANREGAIFELATNGTLQTVAWLDPDLGENASAGLIAGVDGNFYGATSSGGEFGAGTFFQVLADSLQISPASGFTAVGPAVGPFNPSSGALTLKNLGTTAIQWVAVPAVPWLAVSPLSGILPAGAASSVTVTLNTNAASLNLGTYSGTVWFTNLSSGSSQGRQFSVDSGNSSFESGSFAGWTVSGDTNYTFVGNELYWSNYVHSGADGALLGTSGAVGTLSQTLPTMPGTVYLISFWLDNPVGGIPSLFQMSWGGQTLFEETNLSAFGWTEMQFTAPAENSLTPLQFTFRQDYDYFGLSGVQVTVYGPQISGIEFTLEPVGATNVAIGSDVDFTAAGKSLSFPTATIQYQWSLNGVVIPGATTSDLSFQDVQATNGGMLTVTISDGVNAATSLPVGFSVALPTASGNTNFASRFLLAQVSDNAVASSNTNGTPEPGGPQVITGNPGGKPIWFQWQPTNSGTVVFTTRGSDFDTTLGAYTGTSVSALTRVPSCVNDDDAGGHLTSKISFNYVAGTSYEVLVDGYWGVSGHVVLSWITENFAQPLPSLLQVPPRQTVGSNGAAVTLVCQPNSGVPLWYFDGQPTTVTGPDFPISMVDDTNVGTYVAETTLGGAVASTEPAHVQFNVLEDGTSDSNSIAWNKFLDSVNSPYSNPPQASIRKLGGGGDTRGYSVAQTFSTVGAVAEPGEPTIAGQIGGSPYWYTYVSPTNGALLIDTAGSSFNTLLGVFAGSGLNFATLTNIGAGFTTNRFLDGQPQVYISTVTKGQTNFIVVDGYGGASGTVHLHINVGNPVVITTPPQSQSASVGGDVTFTVGVDGSTPLIYMWQFDGNNIAGATNSSLTVSDVQAANVGVYTVVISNLVSIASRSATLSVSSTFMVESPTFNGSAFHLQLMGATSGSYVLQASTNLMTWVPLITNNATNGVLLLTDTNASNFNRRFYRGVAN